MTIIFTLLVLTSMTFIHSAKALPIKIDEEDVRAVAIYPVNHGQYYYHAGIGGIVSSWYDSGQHIIKFEGEMGVTLTGTVHIEVYGGVITDVQYSHQSGIGTIIQIGGIGDSRVSFTMTGLTVVVYNLYVEWGIETTENFADGEAYAVTGYKDEFEEGFDDDWDFFSLDLYQDGPAGPWSDEEFYETQLVDSEDSPSWMEEDYGRFTDENGDYFSSSKFRFEIPDSVGDSGVLFTRFAFYKHDTTFAHMYLRFLDANTNVLYTRYLGGISASGWMVFPIDWSGYAKYIQLEGSTTFAIRRSSFTQHNDSLWYGGQWYETYWNLACKLYVVNGYGWQESCVGIQDIGNDNPNKITLTHVANEQLQIDFESEEGEGQWNAEVKFHCGNLDVKSTDGYPFTQVKFKLENMNGMTVVFAYHDDNGQCRDIFWYSSNIDWTIKTQNLYAICPTTKIRDIVIYGNFGSDEVGSGRCTVDFNRIYRLRDYVGDGLNIDRDCWIISNGTMAQLRLHGNQNGTTELTQMWIDGLDVDTNEYSYFKIRLNLVDSVSTCFRVVLIYNLSPWDAEEYTVNTAGWGTYIIPLDANKKVVRIYLAIRDDACGAGHLWGNADAYLDWCRFSTPS